MGIGWAVDNLKAGNKIQKQKWILDKRMEKDYLFLENGTVSYHKKSFIYEDGLLKCK